MGMQRHGGDPTSCAVRFFLDCIQVLSDQTGGWQWGLPSREGKPPDCFSADNSCKQLKSTFVMGLDDGHPVCGQFH